MTQFKNYYLILNIQNFANADEIKKGFRAQANKLHPDKNKSVNAHFEFIEVNEANNILNDTNKRIIYDEILRHQLYKSNTKPDKILEEKRQIVMDWILFERSKLFEKLAEKTDRSLTETFNFIDHYGMGIIAIFIIIIFISAITFNK